MSININQLITQVVPSESTDNRLITSDDAITSRKQVRLIPRERSAFGSQTEASAVTADTLSDRLTMYISDNDGYLDTQNMYFSTKFTGNVKTNGNVNLPNRFIDLGGIQSCIKEVRLSCGGQTIERIREYSKLYSIFSLASHSPEHVDYVLSAQGDSMNSMYKSAESITKFKNVTFTLAQAVYDHTGGASEKLLTLSAGADAGLATTELRVDDELLITYGDIAAPVDYKSQIVRVTAIVNKNNINVDGFTADIAAGDVRSIEIVGYAPKATRQVVADGTERKVTFKLNLDFFKQHKYFPLRFLKSPLELEIEFNDARNVLVLRDAADVAVDNKFGYVWSEPRLIAPIVHFDKEMVVDKHEMIYRNQGLVFPYMSFEHHSKAIEDSKDDTTNNSSFLSNLKNVRYVIMVLTDRTRANSTGETSQNYASQSSFLKDGITDYRFKAGALSFPEYDKVDVKDSFGAEAWEQLQLVMNKSGNILHDTRIAPYEWQDSSSTKFIMATRLDKHEGMLSGLDISRNYLEVEQSFSSVSAKMTLHCWMAFDAILRLSSDNNVEIFK